MARTTVTPPAKFLVAIPPRARGYGTDVFGEGSSEDGAVKRATEFVNQQRDGKPVLIYQLVKIVKPVSVPIEVETVSCCEDKKAKK
jgi:hypothetical protein